MIIAVIGSPGVGKSFLVGKLAKILEAIPILEESRGIHENILENFRKNNNQVQTLLWFRNKCIDDLKLALNLKREGKSVVMDTYLTSNHLHITTLVSGFEQEILLKQAELDQEFIPKPDLVIFLDASEEKIRELTIRRGRDFDTNEEFIQRNLSIRKAHLDYYNSNKNLLIYINRDEFNFENEEDLKKIISKIEEYLKTKLNLRLK